MTLATLLLIVCTAPWSSVDAIPADASTPPVGLRQRVEQEPSTEDQGAVLRGTASWYRVGGLTAAAGPRLRRFLGPDWRGTTVVVSANGRSVAVQLTGWCQCYRGERLERLLDLSDDSFGRLAPLAVGLVDVRVSLVVPPPTDTAP